MSRSHLAPCCLALIVALISGTPPLAADPPALESLFPQRMALSTQGDRLARTHLPPEVVAACRGDLSDLRLLDSRGQEVPYIIDSGAALESVIAKRATVALTLESVERSPRLRRESYLLRRTDETEDEGQEELGLLERKQEQEQGQEHQSSLPSPPGGHWDLVLTVRNREFVRKIRVETEAGEVLASGSLFRLANPLRQRLRIALTAFDSPTLRVHIEGRGKGYLEPIFKLESSADIVDARSNEFSLTVLSTRTVEQHTIVELDRPPGLIPDRLRLSTSTAAFSRPFEVWDEGAGARAQPLAQQALFRLPSQDTIEETELTLRRARGDRLRVVIENGDSPPLVGLAFTAILRQPAILFVLPAQPAGSATATLYYGGGRAHRPRYDVAALLPALPASELRGELAQQMYDPANLATVQWSAAEPNPRFDPSPALAFAMRAGRQLDPTRFTHQRPLTAHASPDGLIRHQLGVDTLALARADQGDIRIVDAESRQWPYLIEHEMGFETLVLPVEEHEIEGSESIYTLTLPASPMVIDEIVIDPPVSFFERTFRLEGGDPNDSGNWLGLASGPLRRRQGDRRKVHIPTNGGLVTALRLVVQDNQDGPLDLGSVELRHAATELFFTAPAGDYTLLVGNPEAEAPRYELAAVRNVVLAVDAVEATTGPLGENPSYSTLVGISTRKGLQQVALWGVLGLAVVVLGWFTFRLTGQQTESGG